MKVIISMSGLSSRFSDVGYTIPKFMIDIDGKKVIEHIIDLYPKDSDFLFIINDKHAEDTDIINLLEGLKLVGEYLDKTILQPNNLNQPTSRNHFINSLK